MVAVSTYILTNNALFSISSPTLLVIVVVLKFVHITWHSGSEFSNQGLNPGLSSESAKS